ncbi:MAG: heavy-metal-associated domain-containing protein [Methanothrix sp.]|nr:MAG: heavy-metal-associated domain-containing protein [Methanothrix sp.]
MAEIEKAEIKVAGMACAGCSGAVEKALSRLEGVTSAKVDLANKTAYVDYDRAKLSLQDLKEAVEGAGYRVG